MGNAIELIAAGKRCAECGDLPQAEQLFQQAVAVDQSNDDVFLQLGMVSFRLGKPAEAAQQLDAALKINPENAGAHNFRGVVLNRLGDGEQAIASFERATQLQPDLLDAQFNLGRARLSQKRPVEALQCLQQCVAGRPDWFEAKRSLGDGFLAINRGNEAVECYMQALELNPGCTDLFVQVAEILTRQGKLEPASVAYRQALRLQPDVPELHANLGGVLRGMNRIEEAEESYRRAIELKPSMVSTCLNLGVMLAENNREKEAVPIFEQVLLYNPNNVEANSNLGTALTEAGRHEEATNHFREALNLDPYFIPAFSTAAIHDLIQFSDVDVERMQGVLNQEQESKYKRSLLCFALANIHKRKGQHEEAFEFFHQGNALRNEDNTDVNTGFSADEHHELVDALIRAFSTEHFNRLRDAGSKSELPVFVVGMPRSGTSLVEQILASHSEVFGAGELREIADIASRLPELSGASSEYPDCMKRVPHAKVRSESKRYLNRLMELSAGEDEAKDKKRVTRVVDKMPNNFLHVGLIHTLFPEAKIIHCRRHPLDTCLSCYTQWFRGLNFSWNLRDLGEFYLGYLKIMDHWRTVLPDRILEVDYEKMVDNQEDESRRLLEFCDLEWEESCLNFHENERPVHTMSTMQVRKPIYKSSVGGWRKYEHELKPLIDTLADVLGDETTATVSSLTDEVTDKNETNIEDMVSDRNEK